MERKRKHGRYESDKSERKKSKRSENKESEDEFSFEKYKIELNKVFYSNSNLVQDIDDFWRFLKKYESLQKNAEGKNDEPTVTYNDHGLPNSYDKRFLLNFKLNIKFRDLFYRLPEHKDLTKERLKRFEQVIVIYLDFKQKEKFQKLIKLRQEQKNLPVYQYRDQIIESVKNERVVIIAGDTGCGKSTQVPQYLYHAGYESIACTQPRRIACISLAKRVAHETLTENYNHVGYQIRFEKQRNQNTKITFVTEGLLLRQVSGEEALSQYDVIVLDEVHERHLYGDFLLGIMKCLIHQRQDLKLVLMSATINIKLFGDYFSHEDVKIIEVPGRLYAIELMYKPVTINDKLYKGDRFDPSPYIQILQVIDHKYPSSEKGDLLIFLSGISEITAVVDAAKEYASKKNNWIILMLHSTLSIAEQDKVFGYPPDGVRKCIVSTNIAETSVTIDGIRFVVDSGKVKEMSYDPTCKMQRLKEFWISKASAEQRKGRAGRTGPGVCYRLYSEEEYKSLEQYSTPELQRVPLDSLLLQMIAMGLPDPRKFPFIEAPPADSIENSILSLKEHGALTENEKLTTIGKTLAKLPVDITIGKMLIMGSIFHQVEPVLSLAAALSVQNPFTNKAYRDIDCETSRKNLESDHGDPITLLNAYREWLEIKQENSQDPKSSSGTSKKWCRRRGLEEQRFYEMTKLRNQFKELLQDCKLLSKNDEINSSMSSAERAIRHGELKLLKSLKRSYKQSTTHEKKKLKVDSYEIEYENNPKEDGEIDIKDIEFRMKNNLTQVQNLVTATTACSYKDLIMLKLILCSGLYPQFACADEYNYCKSATEQLFHTKVKPYVGLHPLSFFGNNPKVLHLEESDIMTIAGYKTKFPVSQKHQLLSYLSLLETTKPYLVNTLRMPAAQTLLLFSQEIDTNDTVSTMICDAWLKLEFPTMDAGLNLLLRATKLRQKWEYLLNQRLQNSSNNPEQDLTEIEEDLCNELIEYMNSSVPYTLKRLLPADLKVLYIFEGNYDPVDPNPFDPEFECTPHEKKGGVRLTKFLTYNCLIEDELSVQMLCQSSENTWDCPKCSFSASLSSMEKLQHLVTCDKSNGPEEKPLLKSFVKKKKNSQAYECFTCKETLYLTPIEILKHKKQHSVT